MSEFINENPDILDESLLPSRLEDKNDAIWDKNLNVGNLQRRLHLLNIHQTTDCKVYRNIELVDKLLSQRTASNNLHTPDLTDAETEESEYEEAEDPIDAQEIYDMIAHISDPEHPLTLGQLAVVNLSDIEVREKCDKTKISEVVVKITPTITHCSLATLIGLGIRVRLERSLPSRYRINILLKEGSHQSENQVNKQLNDKERVAAACENDQLLGVVSKMLSTCK
ncbi:LANO_0E12486g1_1 [Lachancea nothofagi CBS 11611]|uniref:LANO_0E12486g1_1 n=1 Tax=Lachancea nothofagi CBS 11611 TaxID=1266666 RepID=A0A1G4JY69_9SACH|nr:LANO_0E12486g1_1 [Lachancea nothofagi CBS 11611]